MAASQQAGATQRVARGRTPLPLAVPLPLVVPSLVRAIAIAVLAAVLVIQSATFVRADEHSHTYAKNEDVIMWVNTVGPYNNRQETYPYYRLPFCSGQDVVEHHHETLGEVLQGMELVNAGIGAKYLVNVKNVTLCTIPELNEAEISVFRHAISSNYWYQLYVDDLPVWGFIGFIGDTRTLNNADDAVYIYTHRDFSISYNGDQIIEINLTTTEPVRLPSKGSLNDVRFSWSLSWNSVKTPFKDRFDKYLDQDFFEHKIHWFSIFNSFMMVIFLVGLVVVILMRTLNKDFARYDRKDALADLDRDMGDEFGWKQVHGDVFRAPPHLPFLSAFVGTGWQLGVLTLIMILYTINGDLYTERSTILTASVFCYALTSFIAGFFSGSFHSKYNGSGWIRVMFITALLWPGVVSAVTLMNNFVALYYESSRAIHFGTLMAIIAIWFFLVFPLTLFGTVVGRNWAGQPDFPCRVNPIPRAIPEKKWFLESWVIIIVGGILPFGSIFIEMYFVFTSFWAYKIYYVYGFMLLVFVILLIVSACVTIVATYFLLNSEDHRWHWTSFLTSGSTAMYVMIYAIYYFFARTKMTGFFQTFFYFSFTSAICFGLFLTLGTIGFVAAEMFIRRIYQNVKID